jgi:hypothetical protein
MLASKMSVLKPLIESKEGQHLTAYLTNDKNTFHLKRQLRETLEIAYEYLAPVMSPDALVRFVTPIHNALDDTKLLENLKGNVGIFRNEGSFRILSLPIPVEQTCVIATSFHVKPLLRWMQVDREFLFLGIGEGSVSLYQGNQSSFNLVDTINFPAVLLKSTAPNSYEDAKKRRVKSLENGETLEWINDLLISLTKDSKPPLFVAAQKEFANAFLKGSRYQNIRRRPVWSSFSQEEATEICLGIRAFLKKAAKEDLEQALMEFYQAEDFNLANKNIFQIARAAIKGRVRKLIIADGINIFGKIDKKSGGLAIHPAHLDHQDDDLLDDLAQEVLAQGGEVIVASREEIPKGRPVLAILERPDSELSKLFTVQSSHGQKIERSAV